MFILSGIVVGIRQKKFKTGDRAGSPYNVVQVMIGTDNFKQVLDVVDYNSKPFSVGENVELPVYIKAYVSQGGSPGLDIKLVNIKAAA